MKWLSRFMKVREVVLLILLAIALFLATSGGIYQHKPFTSSELRFSEPSKLGMQIIPASCPSNPHYSGECSGGGYSQGSYTPPPPGYSQGTYTNSCTAEYFCTGSDLYHRNSSCVDSLVQACANGCSAGACNAQCTLRYYCSGDDLYYGDLTYSYCSNNKVQTCGYGCSGSACLAPPPPAVTIRARPALVHNSSTTEVTWGSTHATACTVTSDGGDTWTGLTGTKTSKVITQQTTFTAKCTGEDGSTVIASAIVNLIPYWQEQ